MIRTKAIPVKFFDMATRQLRTDLTAEELEELKSYGPQPLTAEETAAVLQQQIEDDERIAAEAARRAATEYQELRRREYPDIGDQLDAIMKWLATESEFGVPAELKSLAMACMSVKSKYPKPDSN